MEAQKRNDSIDSDYLQNRTNHHTDPSSCDGLHEVDTFMHMKDSKQ
jgi:hypothetical protein